MWRPAVIWGSRAPTAVVCRAAGVLAGYRRDVREAGRYWKIFGPGSGVPGAG
jgi:hypothetical protein